MEQENTSSLKLCFSSSFAFPLPLSPLPPCIIPLVMCQCNFGVQDVSSLKRMCFLCPVWAPPLLCYSHTFFSRFLFREHICAVFQLYSHLKPICAGFQQWWSRSHTFAITELESLHWPGSAGCCFSLLVLCMHTSHTSHNYDVSSDVKRLTSQVLITHVCIYLTSLDVSYLPYVCSLHSL